MSITKWPPKNRMGFISSDPYRTNWFHVQAGDQNDQPDRIAENSWDFTALIFKAW